jgi:hypothetical protein
MAVASRRDKYTKKGEMEDLELLSERLTQDIRKHIRNMVRKFIAPCTHSHACELMCAYREASLCCRSRGWRWPTPLAGSPTSQRWCELAYNASCAIAYTAVHRRKHCPRLRAAPRYGSARRLRCGTNTQTDSAPLMCIHCSYIIEDGKLNL